MRIVNRETFLALPAGTIYAKGVQWAFDSLCIKGESLQSHSGDWFYLDPCWARGHDPIQAVAALEDSLQHGTSFAGEDAESRDGMFDLDAVFMVFEKADLETLRGHIETALKIAG